MFAESTFVESKISALSKDEQGAHGTAALLRSVFESVQRYMSSKECAPNRLPAASIDNVIPTVDVEGITCNELGTIHCENSHSDANIID